MLKRRNHPRDHDFADDHVSHREALNAVPNHQREAGLALGATRWETIRYAVLPYNKSGIIAAVVLGLGRALGETMAVTMVIGNVPSDVLVSVYAGPNRRQPSGQRVRRGVQRVVPERFD